MSNLKCVNCNFSRAEVREIDENKFLWKIHDFKNILHEVSSPAFKMLGYSWRLKVYPNADDIPGEVNGKVRLTLHLEKRVESEPNESIKVCYIMSIINRGGENMYQKTGTGQFEMNKKRGHGFNILSRANLFAQSVDLLPRETLTVCCSIILPQQTQVLDQHHTHHYLAKLGDVLEEQKFGDVEIILSDGSLRAYKGILASRSPVFEAMFAHDSFVENQTNKVEVPDVSRDIFKSFLMFMYTNKIPDHLVYTEELLRLGHRYDIQELQKKCEEHCISSLTIENVSTALVVANELSLKEMKNRIMDFIKANWGNYIETKGFYQLTDGNHQLMKEIIKYSTT